MGARFEPAFKIVQRNEGGYINHPQDPGGETYQGIARALHPNWEGWTIIDFYKSTYGPIPTGSYMRNIYPPGAWIDSLIKDFFRNMWDHSRAGQINNQKVANIYFDFYVLHSQAVKAMQEALNTIGFNVWEDNIIGPQTLGAINQANPFELHDAFKKRREAYHLKRRNSPFFEGWIARNNKFPNLVLGSSNELVNTVVKAELSWWALVGAFGLGAGLLLNQMYKNQKKKAA